MGMPEKAVTDHSYSAVDDTAGSHGFVELMHT